MDERAPAGAYANARAAEGCDQTIAGLAGDAKEAEGQPRTAGGGATPATTTVGGEAGGETGGLSRKTGARGTAATGEVERDKLAERAVWVINSGG